MRTRSTTMPAPGHLEVAYRTRTNGDIRSDGTSLSLSDLAQLQADASRDSAQLEARGAHWGMTSSREIAGRAPGRRMTARRAEQGLLWALDLEHRVLAADLEEVEDVEDGSWDELIAEAGLLVDAYGSWAAFWRQYRELLAGLPPVVASAPVLPSALRARIEFGDHAPPGDPAAQVETLIAAPGAPAGHASVRPRI